MQASRARLLVIGALVLAATLGGCGSSAPTYRNPVFEPILADPSVIRSEDGTFYAYGTEDDWGDGEGSKRIPVVRSDDLVEWEYVGEAFDRRPAWKDGYLWAPDIARWDGRYLLYYSVSVWGDANPGIGVATAEDPAGPFEDEGMLLDSEGIGVANSIDPHLVVDGGTPYLVWGSFHGINLVRLSDDGLSVAGEPAEIAGDAFEAPYLVEREGAWWLFVSLGSCCDGADSTYRLAVGRADALEGPYLDRAGNDLLDGEGEPLLGASDAWVGPGHNSIVTDDAGQDWILYHAIDPERPRADSGATRRPMLIDRLEWDDGWPAVVDGHPTHDDTPAPSIDGGDE